MATNQFTLVPNNDGTVSVKYADDVFGSFIAEPNMTVSDLVRIVDETRAEKALVEKSNWSLEECINIYGKVLGPCRYNEQFADINDVFVHEDESMNY